jgi:hypothetical protein
MLLTGVLFVLFLGGCWLYCLTDAALTPATAYQGRLPKAAWVGIIATTFVLGAAAWLIAQASRERSRAYASPYNWHAAEAALARHPATRSQPDRRPRAKGPDDDPEFLRTLDRIIRGAGD